MNRLGFEVRPGVFDRWVAPLLVFGIVLVGLLDLALMIRGRK